MSLGFLKKDGAHVSPNDLAKLWCDYDIWDPTHLRKESIRIFRADLFWWDFLLIDNWMWIIF